MTGFPPETLDKLQISQHPETIHPARRCLESLHSKFNKQSFIAPDPLQFLYSYPEIRDREIIALIASSLAYGRVRQILASVNVVLDRIGKPYDFLTNTKPSGIRKSLEGFKHRFTTGDDLANLLIGVSRAIKKHDSLERCFLSGYSESDENILPGLGNFVTKLEELSESELGHLLPHPKKGSACKRLNLFLRWMVRKDDVDLCWWDIIQLGAHIKK